MESRWIPVDERLPEESGIVLITGRRLVDGYCVIQLAAFAAQWGARHFDWDHCNDDRWVVSHWMPLPPPPVAAEEGV